MRAKPASGAPMLSKFGNLSIREILVVTVRDREILVVTVRDRPSVRPYVRPSVRPSVRPDSREGEGSLKTTRPGGGWVENENFSWREIARCFWATGVFLGGKSHDHRRFWKRGFFTGNQSVIWEFVWSWNSIENNRRFSAENTLKSK